MTATPKTIDLPPEPPIGTEWRDCDGHHWRHEPEGWTLRGGTARYAWSTVCRTLPLALIEPNPWPTEPLIVASIGERREVLARNEGGGYESPITSAWKGGPTLSDVIPVTVVPTAALPVLWSALDRWVNGPGTTAGDDLLRLVGAVVGLREQIDALGLDQCGADITHRDEHHRQSVCVRASGHSGAHDDGQGCVWTGGNQ